jgi:hypothetical protein
MTELYRLTWISQYDNTVVGCDFFHSVESLQEAVETFYTPRKYAPGEKYDRALSPEIEVACEDRFGQLVHPQHDSEVVLNCLYHGVSVDLVEIDNKTALGKHIRQMDDKTKWSMPVSWTDGVDVWFQAWHLTVKATKIIEYADPMTRIPLHQAEILDFRTGESFDLETWKGPSVKTARGNLSRKLIAQKYGSVFTSAKYE